MSQHPKENYCGLANFRRTRYDMMLQKEWCPTCVTIPKYTKPMPMHNNGKPITYYNYDKSNYRSWYDQRLQQKWCPQCDEPGPKPYGGQIKSAYYKVDISALNIGVL